MSDAEIVKATIRMGDKSITFEGPREFVEEQVARYTGLLPSKQQASVTSSDDGDTAAVRSERDFVQAKQPSSHSETIAVLAYYLTACGVTEFSEEEVRRAYIRAGVRPPKVMAQALRDAKNRYEYVEPAQDRGKYRLTAHGDRTVRFDLPRR